MRILGEVTADRRGEWVLIPEQPIGSGNRLLSAEASSPQNGSTVKSEETVALSISPTAPAKAAGETALAVVLPREGGHARVLQLPVIPREQSVDGNAEKTVILAVDPELTA